MNNPGLIVQAKNEAELKEIKELKQKISNINTFFMIKTEGQEIQLPPIIAQVLNEIINILSNNGSLTLIPMDKELTTQQAADILNVSRPYIVKLLQNNEIPYRKVGTHRKILMKELIEYKIKSSANRKAKLSELVNLTQELELYD